MTASSKPLGSFQSASALRRSMPSVSSSALVQVARCGDTETIGAAVAEQDRLAQLPIPLAQAERLPLIGGDDEIRAGASPPRSRRDRRIAPGLPPRRSCARPSRPACRAGSCAAAKSSRKRFCICTAPQDSSARVPGSSARGRRSRRPGARPRCGKAGSGEHLVLVGGDEHVVVGRFWVKTGICCCTWTMPESVRRAPPVP